MCPLQKNAAGCGSAQGHLILHPQVQAWTCALPPLALQNGRLADAHLYACANATSDPQDHVQQLQKQNVTPFDRAEP